MANTRCISKVLTWFTSHFSVDSRDWDLIEKYGMEYHPLWGYYKSGDEVIIEKQIKAMCKAKIDVIVYAEFTSFDWSLRDIEKDKTLVKMIRMLEDKTINTNNLKLCLMLHRYPPRPYNNDELKDAFKYISENITGEEVYFNHKVSPLLLIYGDDPIDGFEKLKKEYSHLNLKQVFGTFFEQKGWKYCEDYPQKINKEWMPVSPGADSSLEELYMRDMYLKYRDKDSKKSAFFKRFVKDSKMDTEDIKKNPIIKYEWNDGKFYQKQLARAAEANPEIIFIASWNDWQFKNQIEPSKEYVYKYIDMTAEILGR